MPGATTARLVLCWRAISSKAFLIPQTVPNKPTNGAVDPTVAKKYKPELVIDLATLTGAAARAIGKQGIVAMGNDKDTMVALKKSGKEVQERLAEFPFWDEYAEDLKSNIADMKNLGGPEAGAITAGKFLEHFTDYPYTHLDIAGSAFMLAPFNYRGKGGTGVGVRLLFNFLKKKAK